MAELLSTERLRRTAGRTRTLAPSPPQAARLWSALALGFVEHRLAAVRTHSVRTVRVGEDAAVVRLRRNGLDAFTFYEIFVKGVYDSCFPLPPSGVALDLGANIGMTSLLLVGALPQGSVIAVEPDAENAAMWRLNLARHADRTTLVEGALSDTPESIFLEQHGPTSHSIGRSDSGEPGRLVRGVTLDELDELVGDRRLNVMKVDVEGAEVQVFRRGWSLLERTDTVLMEIHVDGEGRQRIIETLATAGLRHVPQTDPELPDVFRRDA